MAISLEKFNTNNKGKRLGVPWGYVGQCVSSVQQYLYQCLGYEMHPRGNAKDYGNTLVREGIAYKVTGVAQRGDIIVYGSAYGGGYGHIGIADGKGNIYDQNNTMSGRNGTYGSMKIFGTYTLFRTYKKAPTDNVAKADQILYKGSKVRFNGIFTVTGIDIKNNLFASNTLTGKPTKAYHWLPSAPFVKVDNKGNKLSNQYLSAGNYVKNDTIYTVQDIDKPTNSAKLNINGRTVWVYSKYLYETSNN